MVDEALQDRRFGMSERPTYVGAGSEIDQPSCHGSQYGCSLRSQRGGDQVAELEGASPGHPVLRPEDVVARREGGRMRL